MIVQKKKEKRDFSFDPNMDHLNSADFKNVYEPSEDTWLFVDALYEERHFLQKLNPLICLEIGSGSGYVTTYLHNLLRKDVSSGGLKTESCCFLCTDINIHACMATSRTLKHNQVDCSDVVLTNLMYGLVPRIMHSVDVILFNPPYVPTPEEELNHDDIRAAWAGGKDGREVIDKLLPHIKDLLSNEGAFYMIAMEENNPDDIIHNMKTMHGMHGSKIKWHHKGGEKLFVLKFSKH